MAKKYGRLRVISGVIAFSVSTHAYCAENRLFVKRTLLKASPAVSQITENPATEDFSVAAAQSDVVSADSDQITLDLGAVGSASYLRDVSGTQPRVRSTQLPTPQRCSHRSRAASSTAEALEHADPRTTNQPAARAPRTTDPRLRGMGAFDGTGMLTAAVGCNR